MITTEQLHRDIETILELDPGTIKGHENLEEINWDSLSVITFIAHMDSNYGISIPASKIKGVQKIEELYNVVVEISWLHRKIKIMKEKITGIVIQSLIEVTKDLNIAELNSPTIETRLYGSKSALDSISLVTLIADIEDRISSEFGKDIVLADERAMSQRLSPFGRVGTLVDYIEKLLSEEQ